MRPFINAVLAASLVLAPTASIAAGTPAPPPTDEQARAGADLQDPNQAKSWYLIGLAILAAILLLLVLLDDDDEDAPVSP